MITFICNKQMNNIGKIDCKQIIPLINTLCHKEQTAIRDNTQANYKNLSLNIKRTPTPLEVHGEDVLDKMILNIRTFICASGRCNKHVNRSHRRMSIYNWEKMDKTKNIVNMAKIIIKAWNLKESKNQTASEKEDFSIENNKILRKITKPAEEIQEFKCDYHCNSGSASFKHIHFVKEAIKVKTDVVDSLGIHVSIESVFTNIDKIAEKNNNRSKHKDTVPPAMPIKQTNNYRMHYGDINYIGSNKAIFYFDRGIRGKQIFTNSMYSLKQQPKYNDIVVIDEIVFTSTCKCDSSKQHGKMFPHYRVTCAVGLTCPARLNSYEKIIYARDRNAFLGNFTTAKSMLIRYW